MNNQGRQVEIDIAKGLSDELLSYGHIRWHMLGKFYTVVGCHVLLLQQKIFKMVR